MRKTARPQRKDLFKKLISDLGPTSGKSKFSPKIKNDPNGVIHFLLNHIPLVVVKTLFVYL